MLSVPLAKVLEEAARRSGAAGAGGLPFEGLGAGGLPLKGLAATLGPERPGARPHGVLRPRARRRGVVSVAERPLDGRVEPLHERGPVGAAPGVVRRRPEVLARAGAAELGVGLDAPEVVAGVAGVA